MTDNSEFSYYNIDFELKVTIDISKIFLSNFFQNPILVFSTIPSALANIVIIFCKTNALKVRTTHPTKPPKTHSLFNVCVILSKFKLSDIALKISKYLPCLPYKSSCVPTSTTRPFSITTKSSASII